MSASRKLGTTGEGLPFAQDMWEMADRVYPERHKGRKCGNCSACCGFLLEIGELASEERPGCRYLKKAGKCGVYEQRPATCSGFVCMWLAGFFSNEARPDKAQFIATACATNDEEPRAMVEFTVNVRTDTHVLRDAVVATLNSGWYAKIGFAGNDVGAAQLIPHPGEFPRDEIVLGAVLQAIKLEQVRLSHGAMPSHWWEDIGPAYDQLLADMKWRLARDVPDEADVLADLERRRRLVIEMAD
jgi:hypothetical protein